MSRPRTINPMYPTGTVVWARVQGYPWWPALVVPYEATLFLPPNAEVPAPDETLVVCQFFSDGRISLVAPRDVRLFQGNRHLLPRRGTALFTIITHAVNAGDAWIGAQLNRQNSSEQDSGVVNTEQFLVGQLEEAKKEVQLLKDRLSASKAELRKTKKSMDQRLADFEFAVGSSSARVVELEKERDQLKNDLHAEKKRSLASSLNQRQESLERYAEEAYSKKYSRTGNTYAELRGHESRPSKRGKHAGSSSNQQSKKPIADSKISQH